MAPSTVFSLANRSLKLSAAADLEAHIEPLVSSSDFTEICLSGNTLGVPAAERLAPLLAQQKQLQVADLADLFTGRLLSEIPPALDVLLNALVECPALHTVNLSDNAFGLNTVQPLVDFLRRHTPLQHLILNNNGLGPEAGARVATALAELAERKTAQRQADSKATIPDLHTVVCGRNRLESGSMRAWAAAFVRHKHIQTVRMVQNGIRQEGIVLLLTEGLRHCSQLQTLDLQDNTFTASGSSALAATLPAWPVLEELGVSDCLLSARGGVLLGEALAQGKHTQLQTLRAQYDEIDAKGLKGLVTAAKSGALPALRRVELNGNRFGEDDQIANDLRDLLNERRDQAGADEDDETWGLDDLDDMEEDSEEEDADVAASEDEDEIDARASRVLDDADQEEDRPVNQKKDSEVDELASALDKTL